ncbi:MAG: 2-amino-4-hydroxy-6-hydroxymethyldihydropteridine diphosphokinase [Planctomycetota bacterium]
MTERIFIALGANLDERRLQLERGLELLARTPGLDIVARSPWFETEPVGGPIGQGRYLNGVAELATDLAPAALLARLLEIERLVGRDRSTEERFGPRRLDLDLLLYGDRALDEPGLVVPHPRLEERIFVLAPLAALAPELRLPSGCTVQERLAERLAAAAEPSLGTP